VRAAVTLVPCLTAKKISVGLVPVRNSRVLTRVLWPTSDLENGDGGLLQDVWYGREGGGGRGENVGGRRVPST